MKNLLLGLAFVFVTNPALGAEQDALNISSRIQSHHLPYDLLVETRLAGPESDEIVHFGGAGDSALWTGVYLAAESYRYAVTRTPESLEAVKRALRGVKTISEVSGTGLLARTVFPVDTPYLEYFKQAEQRHTLYKTNYEGKEVYWVGHITRDQYAGVYFGLLTAYELVDDPEVRSTTFYLVTKLTDFLLKKSFITKNPDGRISTAFTLRPDQRLGILQVAKRVNPERFSKKYLTHRDWHSLMMGLPISLEVKETHKSYFKFNLDYIYLFMLMHPEKDKSTLKRYRKAFDTLRKATRTHRNPHFNMIEHALVGASGPRDQETRESLQQLLDRGFRNFQRDNSGQFRSCGGNQSCDVIPVYLRPPTDFLWQRSPFEMAGGGDGSFESAGADYILPYWMARYYNVIQD
jgi:hypothetical protein